MNHDFKFYAPAHFYEVKKGDHVERRIAGICSTENLDREGERVIQSGLDFSEFVKSGNFNNNHSSSMFDVLGVPDPHNSIQRFNVGETLPNGQVATANCTWVSGRLLDTEAGRRVAELGKALQKEGRALGLSIEGKVVKRGAEDRKTIAAAQVSAIAITQRPVNGDTTLNVLAKSMCAFEEAWDSEGVEKSMTIGHDRVASDSEPYTGEGSARVITPESLEGYGKRKKKKERVDADTALRVIEKHFPGTSPIFKSRVLKLAKELESCSRGGKQ